MSSASSSSPRPARPAALVAFVALVCAMGFAVIGYAAYSLLSTPYPIGWLTVGALALVAGSFALKVPGVPVYLSISDTFFITSALLFGPAPATLTIALDSLFISLRNKKNAFHQSLFNTTSSAIALWVAAQVFFAIANTGPLADVKSPPDARMMVGLACLAALYFALNSGLISAAVSLQKGVPGMAFWRQHFAIVSLSHFSAASASFFLIVIMRFVSPIAIAAVLPLLVIFYLAMRSWLGRLEDADIHIAKVNRLYLSTVSALSTAIEAKDGVTSDHIHRVQHYAMGLAHALKITDPQTLQAIEAAALLHDTGKIAIPEHILNKPGRLTPAEFETMKSHVDVGADILSSIEFPYPVVPIVEAHHENWDGSGYPRRLHGEEIPIGARILSVVDCFDALTSDRPYRPAMSTDEAMKIVAERSGTFYDPHVVETFMRVVRDIAPYGQPQPQLQNAMRRIRRVRQTAPTGTAALERVPVDQPVNDSSEEMLAFVSLARVATRMPTVSDIGALARSHLRQLAPGATVALFTLDAVRNALVAGYTAGPGAAHLMGVVIGVGQRVTGWVAANARTMVNAEAELDLGQASADLRFVVSIPLIADGVVVGVMSLYAPEPFAADCSRKLEIIAPHLATSIAAALAAATGIRPSAFATEVDRAKANRAELHVVVRR